MNNRSNRRIELLDVLDSIEGFPVALVRVSWGPFRLRKRTDLVFKKAGRWRWASTGGWLDCTKGVIATFYGDNMDSLSDALEAQLGLWDSDQERGEGV